MGPVAVCGPAAKPNTMRVKWHGFRYCASVASPYNGDRFRE